MATECCWMLQEELFRVAGLPMVDNCMAGYNSCMFAYGQVSSSQIFDVSITVICKKYIGLDQGVSTFTWSTI